LSPVFDLHLSRNRNPSHIDWSACDFIALIAAGIAQLVDDRGGAATMRSPKSPRRDAAAATHAAGRM
jgi:hypothetical protein